MKIAITTVLAALIASSASAKDIITCGDLFGQAYYKAGGVVPADKAGWRADSVSPGRTIVVANDKGTIVDIKMQAAAGWFSYKDDGCNIVPLSLGDKGVSVVAACKSAIDMFSFTYTENGDITVFFTQHKAMPMISKVTAMVGNCRGQ